MKWTHNEALIAEFNSNFAKPFSSENPFYTVFATKLSEAVVKSDDLVGRVFTGHTNQMMARRINDHTLEVYLNLWVPFQKSTREDAYVNVKCRWNKKTNKLTQIEVKYALFSRSAGTVMLTKRTGTIESMYAEISERLADLLDEDIKAHWAGFTAYYADKVKNMSGYYLD